MRAAARSRPPVERRRRPILPFAVLLALAGALAWFALAQISGAAGRPDRISIDTATGRHVFTVEWAVRPEERSKGLMFREEMAPDHGMVFDFGREQPLYFWMKNTPLSLDMVFIHDDGTVYRIEHRTTPQSEKTVPSGAPVRYVLEVVAGTALRIGLRPGDKVHLD